LDKSNADAVARHLVMAGTLVDEDPQRALEHARAARARAGRVAVVREAAGITAYHAGEWAEAISELRAARRMAGGPGLVAVLADCERALGRPERALELARSPEGRSLTGEAAEELRMVAAGARQDLGQFDAAVVLLQTPELDASRTGTAAARLFYAYADALLAAGRTDDAVRWFLSSASADEDGETDAEERAAELGTRPVQGNNAGTVPFEEGPGEDESQ
jgi:tetratricopeptide (TPR) repeat protein